MCDLSVIVPCYNGEQHIEIAIKSFFQQFTSKMELIVVNDGSGDQTSVLLDEYSNEFENIIVINTTNGGAGRAKNMGIQMATGEYICFLDADDALISDCFSEERLLKLKDYLRNRFDIIYTPRVRVKMDFSDFQIHYPERPEEIKYHMPRLEYVASIYRKDFIDSRIRFAENQEQDIESAFRYRAFSNTDRIVVDRKLPFYLYRTNPNSNTHTWDESTMHFIKAKVYLELLDETRYDEDKPYLCMVVLDNVYDYYKSSFRGVWIDKDKNNKLREVVLNLYRASKQSHILTFKIKIHIRILLFLNVFAKFLPSRKKEGLKTKRSSNTSHSTMTWEDVVGNYKDASNAILYDKSE